MTVKDAIANAFIDRIDMNSFGKEFRVAIDMLQETGERFQYFSLPNAYNKNIVSYIPAALNFRDTPANIPNLDKTTWNIGFEFALTWLNETEPKFQDVKNAIEEFRLYYVNNPKFTVTVNGTDYNCICSVSGLKRSGTIRPENGFKRILMNMSIAVVSGIGLTFGNDTIVEIKKVGDVTLLTTSLVSKQIGNPINYVPTQNSQQQTMKSIPDSTMWTLNGSLTPNLTLEGDQLLYNLAVNNPNFEQEYNVKITPAYGVSFEKIVSIHANLTSGIGVEEKLSVVFTEVE